MDRLLFKLPNTLDIDNIFQNLAEEFSLSFEHMTEEQVQFYDTFDWRLYRKGLLLQKSGERVVLMDFATQSVVVDDKIQVLPINLNHLESLSLKEHLVPIVEMRALIQLMSFVHSSKKYRILNNDDKTVVWFYHDTFQIIEKEISEPCYYLWIVAVRGYKKHFKKLTRYFQTVGLINDTFDRQYTEILELGGHRPGGYSSKLKVELQPEMRTDDAMRILLGYLVQIIRQNEYGIINDVDSEFLHDFRVAVRRTRSALTQIKGVFPLNSVTKFRIEFSDLGSLTNPLRDLDVYLLKEDDYKNRLPEKLRNDIEPLFDYLRDKRNLALNQVIDHLNSTEYKEFLTTWELFLTSPKSPGGEQTNAERPILGVARKRILKRYKQVVADGTAILDEAEDDKLHALRIDCKKLRYLLEFFASLFPPEKIDLLVRQLKILQDNLGDFNDLDVQIDYLSTLANEIDRDDITSNKILLALGYLIAALDQEKEQVKSEFSGKFELFVSSKNRLLFRDLFDPKFKVAST